MQWEWENFHLELKVKGLHSEGESWKWTGRGFLEGSEYTRLQNICLSKKPHKSNVHTEALTQKIKSVEHESIYMESRLGQIVNVVYSAP